MRMINKGLFTSNTPEWATPQAFFDELNKEFDFNLDPCANTENHKCAIASFLQPTLRDSPKRLGEESK